MNAPRVLAYVLNVELQWMQRCLMILRTYRWVSHGTHAIILTIVLKGVVLHMVADQLFLLVGDVNHSLAGLLWTLSWLLSLDLAVAGRLVAIPFHDGSA